MAEPTRAKITWINGMRFAGESGSGHAIVIDSVARPGHVGASPVELLLESTAACTGMDVVSILQKMREPLAGLEVSVTSERAETNPKYFKAITLAFRVRGKGLSREKVERAVELSHSTYCSVAASLRPDCKITNTIEIVED